MNDASAPPVRAPARLFLCLAALLMAFPALALAGAPPGFPFGGRESSERPGKDAGALCGQQAQFQLVPGEAVLIQPYGATVEGSVLIQ